MHSGTRFIDLHLHTRYSDGSWTPAELCQAAARLELAAIAVTDHDTLDGIPQMLAAGQQFGVEVLPAVEITGRIKTREVHLLGYFPGPTWQSPELQAVLDHAKRVREKRVGAMVEQLNHRGIELTVAEVFAGSTCGTVGRPHVALALRQRQRQLDQPPELPVFVDGRLVDHLAAAGLLDESENEVARPAGLAGRL